MTKSQKRCTEAIAILDRFLDRPARRADSAQPGGGISNGFIEAARLERDRLFLAKSDPDRLRQIYGEP